MKNGRFQIGIIGTGSISREHAWNYKRQGDCDIVALCDLIEGKPEALAKECEIEGARYYTSKEEMLANEELDLVSICVYNTQHKPCAIYAMEHGVNVLLEKPFTVTLDEAIDIMKVEKKTGKILSIGFQPRFSPYFRQLEEIIASGRLGKIYYIQTGGGRRRGLGIGTFIEKSTAGVGALGDIGCYSLDMVLKPLGYPVPKTVSAVSSNYFGTNPKYTKDDAKRFNVDDFAAAFIRFDDGLTVDFRIPWAMHMDTTGDTLILGTDAGLRIPSTECWNAGPGGRMTLYYDNEKGEQVEELLPEPEPNEIGALNYYKIRAMLEAIKSGGTAPIPSSQIIVNQAIIDGMLRSAECGHEVEINIPKV